MVHVTFCPASIQPHLAETPPPACGPPPLLAPPVTLLAVACVAPSGALRRPARLVPGRPLVQHLAAPSLDRAWVPACGRPHATLGVRLGCPGCWRLSFCYCRPFGLALIQDPRTPARRSQTPRLAGRLICAPGRCAPGRVPMCVASSNPRPTCRPRLLHASVPPSSPPHAHTTQRLVHRRRRAPVVFARVIPCSRKVNVIWTPAAPKVWAASPQG